MLSGRGREVLRLSSAIAVIFLARQPSDVAKSWGNCSVNSLVTSSLAARPLWAKTQDLLSTWRMFIWSCESMCGCWVTGKVVSCPISHVITESLSLVVLGLPQLKAYPHKAVFDADVQAVVLFQKFGGCDFQLMLIIWPSPEQEERLGFFFFLLFFFLMNIMIW